MKILDSIIAVAERAERTLCALLVFAFTSLVVANIILRYLFSSPLYYAEEVSIILMIWMTFLAASLALGRREMVSVTLLSGMLSEKLAGFLKLIVDLIVLGIVATFLYWSIIWMMSDASSRDIVLTLGILKWYPYLVIPIFFSLACLKSVNNILSGVERLRK